MLSKRQASSCALALAMLALASCSRYDNSALGVAVVATGAAEGTAAGQAGQLVRAATVEGLVAFDDAGRVIPALAERWIVTDDGQSYIFRLREGVWTNGDPITAASARRAINAALRRVRDTPLGLDLVGLDEVRVMAGRVIEIRLERPMPYLLQLLAQPELGMVHEGVGAGPMSVTPAEGLAVLAPMEPSRLGLPAIQDWAERTRQVQLRALPGPAAVAAFNDGTVDLVLGGRIEDFLLTRSVGILRGTIQLDPVAGLFGLHVMNDRGFLAEPGNREALAMAIDRDALIAPFGVGGWVPTSRIVTPSLDGDLGTAGERWADQTLADRRAAAAARVRSWRAAAGTTASDDGQGPSASEPVRLKVWLPAGGGSQVLFNRLAADFATISVQVERVDDPDGADLALVDDVARYPRVAWFLNRLSCRAGQGLCSAAADAAVAVAAKAATPAERAALLKQAEGELTASNVFIPFGTPIRWSLVRGSVDGFATNAWGWHPLMPLSWLPK
ncbi:ABC transporter substrate-binding protein [Novosphingobium soli]|uniref:ABC transporter substrate-binding protein n=1 Tax=Novosphingobium soli TaxID=574956 RepID=A0ABV6CS25_9SPHN